MQSWAYYLDDLRERAKSQGSCVLYGRSHDVSLRCLLFCALVVLALSPMPVASTARAGAGAEYSHSLIRGSRLQVEAKIDGRAVKALLDSAAEVTLVDRKFVRKLKLSGDTKVDGRGSGAAAFDAELVKGVELQVFGVTLKNQTVATADLADVGRRLLGRRLDVILGREIFDAARLRIDIEGRKVVVLSPEEVPQGIRLELVTEHGVETIPALVESTGPVRATFDLGNGTEVLVGRKLAERLHLLTDGRSV